MKLTKRKVPMLVFNEDKEDKSNVLRPITEQDSDEDELTFKNSENS